jgi:hypothetical protein
MDPAQRARPPSPWAAVALLAVLLVPLALAHARAASPPDGMPVGSIVAFLPDPESPAYADEGELRKWLLEQGWRICDGTEGTPDLNYRLLLGTVHPPDAGQNLGSRTHEHQLRGRTGAAMGRERALTTGRGPAVRMPAEGHEHRVDLSSDKAEHLPLSTRVLFIVRVR